MLKEREAPEASVQPTVGAELLYAILKFAEIVPAFTIIVNAFVVDPPEFVAVTVYVALAVAELGVPEITPLLVLKLSPEGKLGLTE